MLAIVSLRSYIHIRSTSEKQYTIVFSREIATYTQKNLCQSQQNNHYNKNYNEAVTFDRNTIYIHVYITCHRATCYNDAALWRARDGGRVGAQNTPPQNK